MSFKLRPYNCKCMISTEQHCRMPLKCTQGSLKISYKKKLSLITFRDCVLVVGRLIIRCSQRN